MAIALIASSASAQDKKAFDSSMCPSFGNIAKTAMTNRQNNILMSDMILAIEKAMGKDDPFAVFGKVIVLQAYESPLFTTKEAKEREINDFANKMMSICYAN